MKRIFLAFTGSLILSVALSAQTEAPTPKVPTDTQTSDKGPAHSDPYAIKDPYWTTHKTATPHFWGMVGGMGASAYAHTKGGQICRHNNGVEPCTALYGDFKATEITNAVITVGTGTGVYYMCRRDTHNSKWCDLIPSIVIAGNTGWGIHEALIHKPKEK